MLPTPATPQVTTTEFLAAPSRAVQNSTVTLSLLTRGISVSSAQAQLLTPSLRTLTRPMTFNSTHWVTQVGNDVTWERGNHSATALVIFQAGGQVSVKTTFVVSVQLFVDMTPTSDEYFPGDYLSFSVRVRDALGTGVPNADIIAEPQPFLPNGGVRNPAGALEFHFSLVTNIEGVIPWQDFIGALNWAPIRSDAPPGAWSYQALAVYEDPRTHQTVLVVKSGQFTVYATPLTVEVQGSSEAEPSEKFAAMIQVSLKDVPVDPTFQVTMTKPDGSSDTLRPQRVQAGIYRLTYDIPPQSSAGTYSIVVSAESGENKGSAVKTFRVSPNFSAQLQNATDAIRRLNSTLLGLSSEIANKIMPAISVIQNYSLALLASVVGLFVLFAYILFRPTRKRRRLTLRWSGSNRFGNNSTLAARQPERFRQNSGVLARLLSLFRNSVGRLRRRNHRPASPT